MSRRIHQIPEPGQKFGGWTFLGETGRTKCGKITLLCRCQCGKEKPVILGDICTGRTESCGCLRAEKLSQRAGKGSGRCQQPIYWRWRAMRSRCENPNSRQYSYYGARGITVCEEWSRDFEAFRHWALTSGYQPHLDIDRRDNDQGYSPANCRFVTRKENANNKRNTRIESAFGETKLLSEWMTDPRCSVQYQTILKRLKAGWAFEAAISVRPHGRGRADK